MSDLENLSALEQLNELSGEAIEKMETVQPVEQNEAILHVEKPNIEEIRNNHNISFKGGNCICSCDLTCTRA